MQLAFLPRWLGFTGLFFLFVLAGFQPVFASKLTMSGASYAFSGPNVTLKVGTIENGDAAGSVSGSLDVELWATIFPHDGQPAVRYLLANTTLKPLAGQTKYENVSQFVRVYQPPTGTYKISMALAEGDGGLFSIVAWQELSKTEKFGWKIIAAPQIGIPTNITAMVDTPFYFPIFAIKNPAEFRATGLPRGLALNRMTGLISGVPAEPGIFNLTVSAGNNGGVDTKSVRLVVGMTPKFSQRPGGTNVFAGTRVTFNAAVSGYPTPQLQWQRNGKNITGATNKSFIIPSAQTKHEGSYQLIASNTNGVVSSGSANLYVCEYVLSPGMTEFGVNGGTGAVQVAVSGGCSWQVINSNSWIHLMSGTNGTGNGVFTFSVDPNTNSAGIYPRVGSLFVGDKQVTVVQLTFPAPNSAAGMTFSFKSTNGADAFFPEKFQILTAARTNGLNAGTLNEPCRILFEGTNWVAGSYSFVRVPVGDINFCQMPVSIAGQTKGLLLNFSNRCTGTFSISADGQNQSGTFAVLPTPADFNHDGLPDLVLQNSRGDMAVWFLDGTHLLESAVIRTSALPKIGAVADFNSDGNPDLVTRTASGTVEIWPMQGTNFFPSIAVTNLVLKTNDMIVGAGDLARRGTSDLLVRKAQGSVGFEFFNGTNYIEELLARGGIVTAPGWRIAGTGDFSGRGYSDILWQHEDGRLAVWNFIFGEKTGHFLNATLLKSVAPHWKLVALTDLNRDSRLDFVWQNENGKLAVWFMDGTRFLGSAMIANGEVPGSGMKVVGPK